MIDQSLRQTGRSTRMVEAAVKEWRSGKNVVLLAAQSVMRDHLVDLFMVIAEGDATLVVGRREVRHDNGACARFLTSHDADMCRHRGMNAAVFVDHHVWECEDAALENKYGTKRVSW